MNSARRTVVLLDEISWLGGYNPDFAGYFKEAWDRKFRKHPNLVFVLCGSVSAWIAENILNSTGFVGRDSLDIELKELTPLQCQQMLGPAGARMSRREKIDLLSVTGGVPKYLEDVRPELSVDENVRRMCFMPRGILFREFDETFNGVFGLQFENLVLANFQTLFPMLGLEESLVLSAAPFFQCATADREKCQIDLMIQTQRMIMVVEIKRRREIGHEIIDEVDEKVRKLKFGSRLSLRTTTR